MPSEVARKKPVPCSRSRAVFEVKPQTPGDDQSSGRSLACLRQAAALSAVKLCWRWRGEQATYSWRPGALTTPYYVYVWELLNTCISIRFEPFAMDSYLLIKELYCATDPVPGHPPCARSDSLLSRSARSSKIRGQCPRAELLVLVAVEGHLRSLQGGWRPRRHPRYTRWC